LDQETDKKKEKEINDDRLSHTDLIKEEEQDQGYKDY
jgi:hypothetical protein